MSERYPGGYITKSPPTAGPFLAPGVWTLDQVMQYVKAGTWPETFLTGTLYSWGDNYVGAYGNYMVQSITAHQSSIVQLGNSSWRDVYGGINSTFAIKPDGSLWAWGSNTSGALGLLDTTNRSSPVQIGTLTNWKSVSTGSGTVAIKTDGTLWAWGLNTSGQLGDGTTINKSSPVQIGTLSNWSTTSSSINHTVAVKTDGTLWSWGDGGLGRLGTGSTTNVSSPVQVGTLTNWSSVSCGSSHVLALKTDGTIWAWGSNAGFRLGDGTSTNRSSPVQIGTLTNWISIKAYSTGSLALDNSNKLYAWGTNSNSSCGSGFGGGFVAGSYSSPIQIALAPYLSITQFGDTTAQQNHAIRFDNSLWGWGTNVFGGVGDGTTTERSYPVQIGTLTNWSQVSDGGDHVLSIKTNGTLWAWGLGSTGQLGDGTTVTKSSPVQVGTLTNWSKVAAGSSHTLAVKTDGTLWSWGNNTDGQLGLGDTTNRNSPVQIGTLTNWSYVAASARLSIAIKTDGTIWSWGLNSSGQLGDGTTTNKSSPIQIGTLTTWASATAGGTFAHAIKTDGTLWAWGSGVSGRLALNSTTNYSSPVQVGTLTNWSKVSDGRIWAAAVKTDGTLWAWGQNTTGELGDGTTENRSSPVQIGTLTNWTNVAGMNSGTSYINSSGEVYASGDTTDPTYNNLWLGSGFPIVSYPVQVGSLTTWASVVSSGPTGGNTFSKKTDGTLWAWGDNSAAGALGLGNTVIQTSPVQLGTLTNWSKQSFGQNISYLINNNTELYGAGTSVNGLLGNVLLTDQSSPVISGQVGQKFNQIARGNSFTIAIDSQKRLWSWGLNSSGELGIGTSLSASGPVQVGTLSNWSNAVAYGTNAFAVNNSGQLYGWGSTVAQGIGTGGGTLDRAIPVQFTQLQVSSVSAGGGPSTPSSRFRLFVSNGALYGIGKNDKGQIGNGSTVDSLGVLSQIGTLTNWSQISCGYYFSSAVKTDGSLWAWGDNPYGQLGQNNTTGQSSPVQVGTLTNWASVSCGGYFIVAIKTNGTLWSWGYNGSGQLGDGTTTNRSSPVQVGTLTNWLQASAGTQHCIAVKTDGTLWAWGDGNSGRLGTGSSTSQSSPVQIGTLTTWTKTKQTSSAAGSIALRSDGTVWSWGLNNVGQLGLGDITSRSSPTQIGTLTNWSDCLMDGYAGYLINTTGEMYGFGQNNDGAVGTYEIGDGTTVNKSSPVQIGNYTTWSSVQGATTGGGAIDNQNLLFTWGSDANSQSVSSVSAISSPVQIGSGTWKKPFIKSDDTLWLWDMSNPIALGIGYTIAQAFATGPVRVGTNTWKSVAKGNNFALAIRSDNTLWGWGVNSAGRLGTGNTTNYSSPVQVGTLSNWSTVAVGTSNTLAVKTDGTLWAWGANNSGQVGDGTTTNRSSPVQIGTLTDWYSVAGGSRASYAVRTNATFWAWGLNSSGELGVGDTVNRSSPTQVGTNTVWKATPIQNVSATGFLNGSGLAAS